VVLSLKVAFEDRSFPAQGSSLFHDPASKQEQIERIQWKRPCEFASKPALFVDGADEGDVVQGELGDCYFIGETLF
jgi:Calpain family cysteine protease